MEVAVELVLVSERDIASGCQQWRACCVPEVNVCVEEVRVEVVLVVRVQVLHIRRI